MTKDYFNFCLGPLVFKGKLDEEGRIIYAERDLGPFGFDLDNMQGQIFEDVKEQMIREGYEAVKQFVDDYRRHAAKKGIVIDG